MKVEVFFDPVFHIIIKDIFTDEENKNILDEAVSLEDKFVEADVNRGVDKNIRYNDVVYYDPLFKDRYNSELLTRIDSLFIHPEFNDLLSSSPYPINVFNRTNHHVTQVSRYGNNSKYDWHIDSFDNNDRIITAVYYFNETPKQYIGGELQLTNSPISSGQPVIYSPKIKTIIPNNNMLVIFDSHTPYRVLPTQSPEEFNLGRFSVNCWIGIKNN